MRRILLIVVVMVTASNVKSQDLILDQSLAELYKFSREYFRSDPFVGEFSGFLNHLINDPGIEQKVTKKRTDTSLYSFEGVYSKFNPFSFKPKRMEVMLQEASMQLADSAKSPDTIFIYQLIAYTDDNPENAGIIKREFERLHRRNNRKFFSSNFQQSSHDSDIALVLYNYFLALYWVAPVTIIRGEMKPMNELFLTITLRFKINGNKAILAGSLNNL